VPGSVSDATSPPRPAGAGRASVRGPAPAPAYTACPGERPAGFEKSNWARAGPRRHAIPSVTRESAAGCCVRARRGPTMGAVGLLFVEPYCSSTESCCWVGSMRNPPCRSTSFRRPADHHPHLSDLHRERKRTPSCRRRAYLFAFTYLYVGLNLTLTWTGPAGILLPVRRGLRAGLLGIELLPLQDPASASSGCTGHSVGAVLPGARAEAESLSRYTGRSVPSKAGSPRGFRVPLLTAATRLQEPAHNRIGRLRRRRLRWSLHPDEAWADAGGTAAPTGRHVPA